ncbi:uncharacterized protein HMPREF1541_05879 [Cyphellophora europaea CBS 101466]|uniref:Uncharacterized protein n=1 Tax=Cyphellophora europaea (strain CBS 101466) TaxID=1220924 RepID=W2RV48_CYPE1|nr:uncharacterized protein HMPREF1541_05879 [Cyphellophora europaea CBS 101466]ETN39653.1 hypothetical protein HMPREF1541_05879 [Cyphellophora europaea CBS 101466]
MLFKRYRPREGIHIDPIFRALQDTILNPCVALALYLIIISVLSSQSVEEDRDRNITGWLRHAAKWVLCVTVAGALLSLNRILNTGSLNNWVTAESQSWGSEIAVITGGSSGIGASVVQQLLEREPDARVVVIDFCPLEFTPPANSKVHCYHCDLSKSDALKAVCERIRTEVGSPTILINSAGLTRGQTITGGKYHDVELTFKTNIIAPFLLVKEFLPAMVGRNHGHIVGISSLSAVITPARLADYGATKQGVLTLQNTLRQELRFEEKAPKVRVTSVVLGFVATPMFKGKTNQSGFLSPLLHVDTVGEAIVDAIVARESRSIWLPGIGGLVAMLAAGPDWLGEMLRNSTQRIRVDYVGRQTTDPDTGGLCKAEEGT